MTRQAAWQHDHGVPAGESANMAKYAAAEAALAALDAAIQAHGGNGLASEYGLLPYWGLARLLRIAPVNREMILNYVAQHSLGLPRSYYGADRGPHRNLIGRINVGDSLTRTRRGRPDQLAVVDGDRRFTYAEFNAYVNRLAHGLAARGLRSAATRSRWPRATAPTSSPSTTRAPSSASSACRSTWAGGRTRWPTCSATPRPAASWWRPSW